MICFVSLEHDSWLANPDTRFDHLSHCMDVKLKIEELTGTPCIVQRYGDVTWERLQELGIRALVISGNATPWEYYDFAELDELMKLIRSATWPTLGLCGGHQLIALAHGGTVDPMRLLRPGEADITTRSAPGYLKEWGYMPVSVGEADPIWEGLNATPEFLEVHYCEIRGLPPGFRVLASSKECQIQTIKQIGKPIYGTQFHPESFTEWAYDRRNPLVNLVYPDGFPEARPDGRRLLANFFRAAGVVE
jgi:GMP synthase (glutamine-hydrolysing)